MHVLIDGRWTDGFLDYHRGPAEYLLESAVWKNLERLQGLYFERPKSLWTIWNYLWDIGPRQTIRKVLSRSRERYRNLTWTRCSAIRRPLIGQNTRTILVRRRDQSFMLYVTHA
jgi:hypothetical protein